MADPQTTREDGYYWIRMDADLDWIVAHWLEGNWLAGGWYSPADEDALYEVDERRIIRQVSEP